MTVDARARGKVRGVDRTSAASRCISGSPCVSRSTTPTLYFDVEGRELAVADEKLSASPTLVVLHGGPGFDQGYLRPGLRAAGTDAQLVFVDLRGQGRSAAAPAQAVHARADGRRRRRAVPALGHRATVVLGHSAGGFVALHLALRHPALPAGLILCHTTPTLAACPTRAAPRARGARRRRSRRRGRAAVRRRPRPRDPGGVRSARVPALRRPCPRRRTRSADGAQHPQPRHRRALLPRLAPHYDVRPRAHRDRGPNARDRRPPRLGLPARRRRPSRTPYPTPGSSSCPTPGTSASPRPRSRSWIPCESTSLAFARMGRLPRRRRLGVRKADDRADPTLPPAVRQRSEALSIGKSKNVSGYGSSRSVKCHHSVSRPLKPAAIIGLRNLSRFARTLPRMRPL